MRPNFISRVMISAIRLYRMALSPWLGGQCRFHPTCSAYGIEAFEKFGLWKGLYLTTTRVCSCHPYSNRPWSDTVPEAFAWRDVIRYNHSHTTTTTTKHDT